MSENQNKSCTDERFRPSIYESSIEGCIYAECPTCTNTMRLGELWADLVLKDGKDLPECPECDDGEGDTWADEADVIVDGHELWACMGDELDRSQYYPELEI